MSTRSQSIWTFVTTRLSSDAMNSATEVITKVQMLRLFVLIFSASLVK